MATLKRILAEFWVPAIGAVLWTAFSLYTAPDHWTLKTIVNVFAPSFFLMSWATGQYFRIKKQTKVEQGLGTIEQRLENVVEKLERQTQDFAGYIVGSEGFASFHPMIRDKGFIELALMNESSYPVFDVRAEVIDLDEPIDPHKGKFWTRHQWSVESLYPSTLIPGAYRFDIRGRNRLHINIFIHTRSGGVTQQIRVLNTGEWPQIAIRTVRGDMEVKLIVPDGFPGYDPTNVKSLFS